MSIRCRRDSARSVEYALSKLKASAITLQDGADQPIYEPAIGEQPLWADTVVTGLFFFDRARANESSLSESAGGSRQAIAALELELTKRCKGHELNYQWAELEEKDWEREWLQFFAPVDCGHGLWVVPSHDEFSDQLPKDNSITRLLLDPGLAFGTGTHPTTFLCLSWLASQKLGDLRVLDYGCGSGILAIAALKRGAAEVSANDIDPQALIATRSNLKRNGFNEEAIALSLLTGDQDTNAQAKANSKRGSQVRLGSPSHTISDRNTRNERYDIIVANILAGPLTELKTAFAGLADSETLLCLSGITSEQAPALIEHYRPDFSLLEQHEREGWSCLIMRTNKEPISS